ncbi:MAG: DUF401 family protein [Lentisphaeria bacterium]
MLDAFYTSLIAVPVLFKILGTLAFILAANAFFKRLGISIAAGALLLAFWSGHSPEQTATIAWTRFSSLDNVCLLVIVFQVISLSNLMQHTGLMTSLVEAVRQRVSHRTAIAALPAIIGMLPMPGGAIFSAPLVDDCDMDKSLDPLLKTRINYWFRHVWEYWWPLYPGVLLAIEISGVDIWQFTLVQFPMSILAVTIGAWFLLRKVHDPVESTTGKSENKKPLLPLLAPIFTVVVTYTLTRVALPQVAALTKYAPMIAALFAGIAAVQIIHPLGKEDWKKVLLSKRTVTLAGLVALVRIYGAFIEARLPGGGLLVEQMRDELAAWQIPAVIIIMLLPFLSGLATGLAVGFVGASFPIVFSLLGGDASLSQTLPTIILAFGFGYMGMILSPVHICLIVTNEHFKTRLTHSIKGLVAPALTMLACVLIVFSLLSWIL